MNFLSICRLRMEQNLTEVYRGLSQIQSNAKELQMIVFKLLESQTSTMLQSSIENSASLLSAIPTGNRNPLTHQYVTNQMTLQRQDLLETIDLTNLSENQSVNGPQFGLNQTPIQQPQSQQRMQQNQLVKEQSRQSPNLHQNHQLQQETQNGAMPMEDQPFGAPQTDQSNDTNPIPMAIEDELSTTASSRHITAMVNEIFEFSILHDEILSGIVAKRNLTSQCFSSSSCVSKTSGRSRYHF